MAKERISLSKVLWGIHRCVGHPCERYQVFVATPTIVQNPNPKNYLQLEALQERRAKAPPECHWTHFYPKACEKAKQLGLVETQPYSEECLRLTAKGKRMLRPLRGDFT